MATVIEILLSTYPAANERNITDRDEIRMLELAKRRGDPIKLLEHVFERFSSSRLMRLGQALTQGRHTSKPLTFNEKVDGKDKMIEKLLEWAKECDQATEVDDEPECTLATRFKYLDVSASESGDESDDHDGLNEVFMGSGSLDERGDGPLIEIVTDQSQPVFEDAFTQIMCTNAVGAEDEYQEE